MFWLATQSVIVIVVLFLCGGLILQPDTSLGLLWNVLIPILPATFLISPILWRSMCPLATLNMLPNGLFSRRALSAPSLSKVGVVGIVLLIVLVPARRFLFNENGIALAITILLVATVAIALGAVFDAKAGFCNAICPILPVEKLYGQHPLWEVRNPRCTNCTLCTPKGCIDIAPKKSITTAIGPATRSHTWLITPFGIFAAAFPGFIFGYFGISDGPLASAGTTYLHIATWAFISYLAVSILVLIVNKPSAYIFPLLAAAAIGIYYWFASPSMLSFFGLAGPSVVILRSIMLAFVGLWLGRALYRVSLEPMNLQHEKLPKFRKEHT